MHLTGLHRRAAYEVELPPVRLLRAAAATRRESGHMTAAICRQLTYSDVVAYLRRFAYKPNFALEAAPCDISGFAAILHLTMYVPDSYRSHPPVKHDYDYETASLLSWRRTMITADSYRQDLDLIRVVGSRRVPWSLYDSDRFYGWLRLQIQQMENHEIDEWFRIDGHAIYDPHAAE